MEWERPEPPSHRLTEAVKCGRRNGAWRDRDAGMGRGGAGVQEQGVEGQGCACEERLVAIYWDVGAW